MGSTDGSPGAWFDADRPAQHPHTLVVTLAGRLDRPDAARIAALVDDHLRRSPARFVICDVGGLVAPDAVALDVICRIRLGARRFRARLRLRRAAPELVDLIDLVGLRDILSRRARSGLETRR